ncbi:MAG: hypothetical protein V4787_02240 [Pseudomonadota bacterium]
MKLQFFLDWGGDFLWPFDDEAERAFGCPTDVSLLPISSRTLGLISKLTKRIVAVAESHDIDDEVPQALVSDLRALLQTELCNAGISIAPPFEFADLDAEQFKEHETAPSSHLAI